MVIVIIAGGSGTRLWPLSQNDHPKHLLALTGERSMLQNTFQRAREITDDIYVVTEISHSEEVSRQLPELSDEGLVIEPGRRGTASCFVLGLSRVKQTHGQTEEVVFIHADHHIPDNKSFATAVRAAAAASTSRRAIALVGIKPTYPATGFGYIESDGQLGIEEGLPFYKVMGFKEKPEIGVAKKYLEAGNYYWNQGLFAAPLGIWEHEFKTYAPYYYEAYLALVATGKDLHELSRAYLALESDAIDYALIEKKPHLVVVPANYEWADIGSFTDLHKILKSPDGNALKGNISMIDCEDSMIHGTDKPIIAIGLSGIVVVDTPEGLLVCAKEQSQKVGELSKKLKAQDKARLETARTP